MGTRTAFAPVLAITLTFGLSVVPDALADGPRLLVLNKGDDTLSIINPDDGSTLATVPTGHGPHEVAVSADGKTAFVANYGDQAPGNSLSVIDISSAKEDRRVDLSPLLRPHGLAVVDGTVYVTAELNRAIGRYNPEADRLDRLVGLGQDGTHMVVASPEGRFLYTANIGSDTITAIDRQNGRITHIEVGKEPEGIDVSPDGREVWASHRVDGLVTVINTASLKVDATLNVGKVAIRVKLTPDGKHALVSDPPSGELVVIDTKGRKEVRRVPVGEAPVGILITPDGARAFVALAGADRVAVVNLSSFEVERTIPTGRNPDGLAWVPGDGDATTDDDAAHPLEASPSSL